MTTPPTDTVPHHRAVTTVTMALSLFDMPDIISVFETIRALRTEHTEAHDESLEWYASTPPRFRPRTLESVVSEFQSLVGGNPEYLRMYVQLTTEPGALTLRQAEPAPAPVQPAAEPAAEPTPEPAAEPTPEPAAEPAPEPTPAPVTEVAPTEPSPAPALEPVDAPPTAAAAAAEPQSDASETGEPAPEPDALPFDARFQNSNWTLELRNCALDITNMLNELKALGLTQNAIVREVKPHLGSDNSISTGSVGQFMNGRYESNGYPVIRPERLPLYMRAFTQVLDARRRVPNRREETPEPGAAKPDEAARREALPTSFRERKATILTHMDRELRAGHPLTFTYNELGRVLGMNVGTVLTKVLSPMLNDGSLVHKGKEAVSLAPN